MKSVRIWSYSGPYFPAFGLNAERYSVSFRIQSECKKIRTRKTQNTDIFYATLVAIELGLMAQVQIACANENNVDLVLFFG